jgi:CubicO group peptidase (beta-lactamase class C family)
MTRITYLLSTLLLITSCQRDNRDFTYPKQLNDNWAVSTPDKEGMDLEVIKQVTPKISEDYENIDGIVVVRHGKLIVDEYFNGYDSEKPHKVFSITKSIVGALVGIAIEQGHLKSEDDSIKNYMGDYLTNKNPSLQNLTVKHVLTMTTGLDWVELGDMNSQGMKIPYTNDWIEFVLNQSMNFSPGTTFNYSSGNVMLLAPIIKNSTGIQADKFADKYLFSPLGIKNYEWVKMSEFWMKTEDGEIPGVEEPTSLKFDSLFSEFPSTGSGLKMRPRDIAKFGQLYLNNGKWDGKQILPEDWIKKSIQPHFNNKEYGYLWRLTEYDFNDTKINCYYGTGFGLQKLYIFPTLDLVVVITQQNYRRMPKGEKETQDIINNYILKSVK